MIQNLINVHPLPWVTTTPTYPSHNVCTWCISSVLCTWFDHLYFAFLHYSRSFLLVHLSLSSSSTHHLLHHRMGSSLSKHKGQTKSRILSLSWAPPPIWFKKCKLLDELPVYEMHITDTRSCLVVAKNRILHVYCTHLDATRWDTMWKGEDGTHPCFNILALHSNSNGQWSSITNHTKLLRVGHSQCANHAQLTFWLLWTT